MKIPFNKPYMTGNELAYIAEAHALGHLSGDGSFTARCSGWLEQRCSAKRALLTHSCTAALDMAALLAEIGPGDEVIMPSYTFVSTANAFALRGARPVFVDIRPDTLNVDEAKIAGAVTRRTRAIVPVHYSGVGCEMESIMRLAEKHGLLVIEDAAQGTLATYQGRPLGGIGHLGALSFHETKNVISGEGGALLVNDARLVERAEIIRDKGTNRRKFLRGEVDKYSWVDLGSSYLPGEIIAAFLWAQMERAEEITARRLALWARYHDAFTDLERDGRLRRPVVPPHCKHNAHMYYLLLPTPGERDAFIEHLREAGILAVFHYVPLHGSAMGRKLGRAAGELRYTEDLSRRLVRLPLWLGLEPEQDRVIATMIKAIKTGACR